MAKTSTIPIPISQSFAAVSEWCSRSRSSSGTVRENVTYGLRLAGLRDRYRMEECLERSLTQAALWDEIKDRLDSPATAFQEASNKGFA